MKTFTFYKVLNSNIYIQCCFYGFGSIFIYVFIYLQTNLFFSLSFFVFFCFFCPFCPPKDNKTIHSPPLRIVSMLPDGFLQFLPLIRFLRLRDAAIVLTSCNNHKKKSRDYQKQKPNRDRFSLKTLSTVRTGARMTQLS